MNFNSRKQSESRARKPFVPRDINHARSESNRRLNRDYPSFLQGFHLAYSERMPLVFHHFAQGRDEHTNETLGQSHREMANICDDLVDRSYGLLQTHPEYKNLYNIAHFFQDLGNWHNTRGAHYENLHSQETQVPEPTPTSAPEQLRIPGTEPQRTPRVC